MSALGETGTTAPCPFTGTGCIFFCCWDDFLGTLAEILAREAIAEGRGDGARLGISVQERDFDEEEVRFALGETAELFPVLALAARRPRAAFGVM